MGGREKDKNDIIEILLDSKDHVENNVSIISIAGIGGVGKITLVLSVYDDEEVVNYF